MGSWRRARLEVGSFQILRTRKALFIPQAYNHHGSYRWPHPSFSAALRLCDPPSSVSPEARVLKVTSCARQRGGAGGGPQRAGLHVGEPRERTLGLQWVWGLGRGPGAGPCRAGVWRTGPAKTTVLGSAREPASLLFKRLQPGLRAPAFLTSPTLLTAGFLRPPRSPRSGAMAAVYRAGLR